MTDHRREVARTLLISPKQELLLIHVSLSDRQFWIPPGGGLKGAETPRAAARRELLEEVGIDGLEIGPRVWTTLNRFHYRNRWVSQREHYFVVRTDRFEPPAEMPDPEERDIVDEFRWWDLRDIERSTEPFVPSRLGFWAAKLLRTPLPKTALEIDP